LAKPGHRVQIIKNCLAEKRNVFREQIGSVHWSARSHHRMIGGQLSAEVETLFAIRPAGGQLSSNREIPPPSSAAVLHSDLELLIEIPSEEDPAHFFEPS